MPKNPNYIQIGIDIDNVLADTYTSYIEAFNNHFKTNLKFYQLTDFYFLEKHSGIEYSVARDYIYRKIEEEDFVMSIKPYEKAAEVIRSWISSGVRVSYVTARPNTGKTITRKWLSVHGFSLNQCRLFMQKSGFDVTDINFKKKIVEKEIINIMIEDSPEIALSLSIPVLLLDRPWNRKKLTKNIKRVNNWVEIEKAVLKYQKIGFI